MKLPRDISGIELAKRLKRYGYVVVRQEGSHLRMTSKVTGSEHHVTIPAHDPLRIGTLQGILTEVARYLERDRSELIKQLFG